MANIMYVWALPERKHFIMDDFPNLISVAASSEVVWEGVSGSVRTAKVRIETQGHFRPSDRWPRVSTFRISVSKVLLGLLTKVDQISHFILYPCGSVGHSLTLRLASLFPQFSKALFIQIATQGHLKDFSLNFRFPSSVDLVTTNSSRRRLYARQFSNKWQFLHFSRSWTTPKKM